MSRFRNSILANESTVTPMPEDRAYKLFPLSNFDLGWSIVKEFNDCNTVQNKTYIIAFNDTVSSYKNESGNTMYFCEKSVSSNFTAVSNGSTYSFTSGTTHRFAIGITSTITKYNKGVTAIYNGYATSISYGGRNTSAGSSDCTTLKQFYYNNNLTTIGYLAFAHNTSLTTSPYIQGNVTKLDEHSFRGLSNVSGILDMSASKVSVILNGVFNSIGKNTQNGITSLIWPTGYLSVTEAPFYNAVFNCDITIPRNITSISGNNMFGQAVGIQNIIIDTTLSYWAFRQDQVSRRTITTVTLKKNCGVLPSQCFYDCYSITDVYAEWEGNEIKPYYSAAFSGVNTSSVRLHVPQGQTQNYVDSGWSAFNIVEN